MVDNTLAKARDGNSNRRSFLRRALGFGAAAGAATLLLSRDKSFVPLAQAGSGSGATVNIDEINYGVGTTELRSTTTDGGVLYAIASATSGSNYGLYGRSYSMGGMGVGGWASASSGITVGVYGRSESMDGMGVHGYAGAFSGFTYGVFGEASSPNGVGVLGKANWPGVKPMVARGTSAQTANLQEWQSNDGTALAVVDKDGKIGVGVSSPTASVHGVSSEISGVGIYGHASATSGGGYGVSGQSDSVMGRGVNGYASASTGMTYGVYGQSSSPSGTGVCGYASASTGITYGIYGSSYSPSGVGVFGKSANVSAKPIVAMGYSGQMACLQEWQNRAGTPLAVVDKDGKLGIGTSSPSFMLHIISGVTGPLTAASAPGAGPAPNSFICENLTSGNYKNQFTFKASGANKYSFGNDIAGTGGQNFFIWDEVAAQAVMYIDSSQRVGLGTLSPTEKLHVVGNVKAASFITGDIVMSNDAKVTEQDDGFAFLNPKGEKIAVLDSEGNFYVKGEVRQLRNS